MGGAVADDDSGVMGNLPRSRPGRRSAKRDAASTPRAGAPAKPRSSGAANPRASASGKARSAGAAPKRAGSASRGRAASSSRGKPPTRERARAASDERRRKVATAQSSSGGFDPIGDAVRVAGAVVGVGLRVAGGIARRIPRP